MVLTNDAMSVTNYNVLYRATNYLNVTRYPHGKLLARRPKINNSAAATTESKLWRNAGRSAFLRFAYLGHYCMNGVRSYT